MEILSSVLGWLLGLLSGPISERIKRHYQRNDIRSGIVSELNEIKVRLAMLVYQLSKDVGTFDKQLLEWERKQLQGYKGDDEARSYSLKKFHLPFWNQK